MSGSWFGQNSLQHYRCIRFVYLERGQVLDDRHRRIPGSKHFIYSTLRTDEEDKHFSLDGSKTRQQTGSRWNVWDARVKNRYDGFLAAGCSDKYTGKEVIDVVRNTFQVSSSLATALGRNRGKQ